MLCSRLAGLAWSDMAVCYRRNVIAARLDKLLIARKQLGRIGLSLKRNS